MEEVFRGCRCPDSRITESTKNNLCVGLLRISLSDMGFTSVDEGCREKQQEEESASGGEGMVSPKSMGTGHHHHLSFGIGGIRMEDPAGKKVSSAPI